MKQRTARGSTCRMPAWCRYLSIAAITACSIGLQQAAAQPPTNTQFYRLYGAALSQFSDWENVKGFSTEHVTGTDRQSVMAGTIYNPDNGHGTPIFVHFDDGHPLGAFPDIANQPNNDIVIYDDQSFFDHRVVDIVEGITGSTTQTFFITSSVREDATQPGQQRDKIKVLAVDINGNPLMPGLVISDVRPAGIEWGNSLYPVHTIFKQVGGVNKLYICGYVTEESTIGYPGPYTLVSIFPPPPPGPKPYPGFTSTKKAFVMCIDVDAPSGTALLACKYYDWTYTGTSNNTPEYDFDIAMRMTELSPTYSSWCGTCQQASWGGDIHVTGSVTAKTGANNVPPNLMFVRSGTMNMIIDDVTLAVNPFSNRPFISRANGDGVGRSEYGVGYVEGPGDGHNYVVSNLYDGQPNALGGPYNLPWLTNPAGVLGGVGIYGGFNLKPDVFTVTHVNHVGLANLATPFNQREKSNLGWALQVLPGQGVSGGTNSNITSANYVIAGMMHTDPTFTVTPGPGVNNVNPFLLEGQSSFTGTTGGAVIGNTLFNPGSGNEKIKVYPNLTGTGNTGTNWNNYLSMGYDMSAVLWGPTFAAKAIIGGTGDFILNAPKWDIYSTASPAGNFLGIKAMFVDPIFFKYGTQTGVDPCINEIFTPNTFSSEEIESTGTFLTELDMYQPTDIEIIDRPYAVFTNQPFDYYGDCTGIYFSPSGNPVYKQGNGVTRLQSAKTTIFPNPASNEINVSLASSINAEANVKVVLVNVQGQVVKELYNGKAVETGNHPISLPQVATGLYIVHVYSNGAMVHQQKLSIQQ